MSDQDQFHNVLAWGEDRDRIVAIQRKFLQYFPNKGTILDLGSGRGFFLDLLREDGFDPEGVEMDGLMQKVSQERGHKIHNSDAVSFLQSSNDKYSGIFASHIIEHLDIGEGIMLLKLIKDHLSPGGVAIIITPRPGSLWATENFWLDTTHVRPYPYQLLQKQFAGFEILAGGTEPDSNPVIEVPLTRRLALKVRRILLGGELYDFVYGGGVSYIVAKKNVEAK